MSPYRCSYCGEACDHPVRLNFVLNGRDRETIGYATLALCTACSNSWCTDRSVRSAEREEWVGTLSSVSNRLRAG
jgi:hypothetical protein